MSSSDRGCIDATCRIFIRGEKVKSFGKFEGGSPKAGPGGRHLAIRRA